MSVTLAFEVARLGVPLQQMANALTASQKDVFVRLPGLLSYWPCGIRDGGGLLSDHSGAAHALTQIGTCPTGYDGNSFVGLGNGVNYLSSGASVLGVSGTETFIDSSIRGLTLGGWFNSDAIPTGDEGLIGKDGANPERGYVINLKSGGDALVSISFNGAAAFTARSNVVTPQTWHFIVGRFTPSSEIAIFVDGVKTVNVTAIPASVFASAQTFEVGRFLGNNSLVFNGKARDLFICASALSDALIEETRTTSLP